MTPPIFVCDSSPIIAFEHLDASDLLRQLTNAVYVPPAVRREVFGPRSMPSWVKERSVSHPISLRALQPRLGLGESEDLNVAPRPRHTWAFRTRFYMRMRVGPS